MKVYLLLIIILYLFNQLNGVKKVYIFHFMLHHWGAIHSGLMNCGNVNYSCEWISSDHFTILQQEYDNIVYNNSINNNDNELITVTLYNIHSWWQRTRTYHPAICELHTNLTMAESEESQTRYGHLFDPSFKNFDGTSTTSPLSSVPRVYEESYLKDINLTQTLTNFTSLIKGASYVASDCHRRDSANAHRDEVIEFLRNEGIRIDGLGRCMSNSNPDGIYLPRSPETRYDLQLKRETISKYLFYMAFENSIESGYVTEKPFDALIAGTVPVYLGDHLHLKRLLPHSKSAILIGDYNNNYTAIAEYLNYLSNNETAYEEYRNWRNSFSIDKHRQSNELLEKSWTCRICEWAIQTAPLHHKRIRVCNSEIENLFINTPNINRNVTSTQPYEGKAVKGNGKQVYYVLNGTLHGIPDMDTFTHMKLDIEKIVVLSDKELKKFQIGNMIPHHDY